MYVVELYQIQFQEPYTGKSGYEKTDPDIWLLIGYSTTEIF